MNTKVITIQDVSVDELADLIADKLLEKINNVKKNDDVLLTRKETASLLNIDISTLYLWVKKGNIKSYGIGNRRYFKKQEVLDSLVKIK